MSNQTITSEHVLGVTDAGEVDALVATYVFGYEVERDWPCGYVGNDPMPRAARFREAGEKRPELWTERRPVMVVFPDDLSDVYREPVGHYATMMTFAWDIVEVMERNGWHLHLQHGSHGGRAQTWAQFKRHGQAHEASTPGNASLAICRAALLAVIAPPPPHQHISDDELPF